MLISKPQPAGQVTNLDGSDKDIDVVDLAALPGAELIPMEGPGPFANPDGASGRLGTIPGVMQTPGNGAPIRAESVSGAGTLQKTAQNTAPKMKP